MCAAMIPEDLAGDALAHVSNRLASVVPLGILSDFFSYCLELNGPGTQQVCTNP
jgi:hypothetical protein